LLKEFIDAFKYLWLENLNIQLKSIDTLADITAGYAGVVCGYLVNNVKRAEQRTASRKVITERQSRVI